MGKGNDDKSKPQDVIPCLNMISNKLNICNDLVKLINLSGQFFGPIFLAAFSSILICITVQIFYCYIIMKNLDPTLFRTMWTLSTSINMVIINIFLVLAITSISEMIYKQVKSSHNNLVTLKQNLIFKHFSML